MDKTQDIYDHKSTAVYIQSSTWIVRTMNPKYSNTSPYHQWPWGGGLARYMISMKWSSWRRKCREAFSISLPVVKHEDKYHIYSVKYSTLPRITVPPRVYWHEKKRHKDRNEEKYGSWLFPSLLFLNVLTTTKGMDAKIAILNRSKR